MNIKSGIFRATAHLFLLFFLVLMIRIILPYLSLSTDIGFLRIKQDYITNPFWLFNFYLHVFTAIVSLIAGFTQFSASLRRNHLLWHRRLGYLYISVVLLLAAPTGFVLGLFANGHLPSQIGFCLLALLWFYFTVKALQKIRTGDVSAHRNFMIRSYSLALSAVTLRLWKLILANTLAPDPLILYQMVTWLGFIPNIVIAELIIRNRLPYNPFLEKLE